MLIYAQATKDEICHYLINVEEGANSLEPEDYEAGYVDYLNYDIDEYIGHGGDSPVEEIDGGMFLFKESDIKENGTASINLLIPKFMDYIKDDLGELIKYIILTEDEI